jgi:hypothetical protein
VNKPCQYRQLGSNRPPVEVTTKWIWFIHLVVTSTGDLLVPSCLYWHGLFTWSLSLLVVYYSPVFCTDMVYSLGRYFYWWSISPQLSVLTWFIHLDVTSAGGLLFPSMLYRHGLFTWSLPQVNKPCQYRKLGNNRPPVEMTSKWINHVSTDKWGLIDHQ